MPKFGCQCGNAIDVSPIPSLVTGRLIRLYDDERIYDPIEIQVDDFIRANTEGRREEWIREFYDYEAQGTSPSSNRDVVYDIVWRVIRENTMHVIQCDACARLYIEAEEGDGYREWMPVGHATQLLMPSTEGTGHNAGTS